MRRMMAGIPLQLNFDYLKRSGEISARKLLVFTGPIDEFYGFDLGKLVYRGQLDDSRPESEIPVTGKDLRAAIDAVLSDEAVNSDQRASIGCNIKWKSGNEPGYFTKAAG